MVQWYCVVESQYQLLVVEVVWYGVVESQYQLLVLQCCLACRPGCCQAGSGCV